MKNYWFQDVNKTDFMSEISKGLNLSQDEVNAIDSLITNNTLGYYIIFESNELRTFLTFDGRNAVFPTQTKLSSSVNDRATDKNTHVFVLNNPKNCEYIGQASFTEDFANKKLYTGKDEITGFDFSAVDDVVDVFPPLGTVTEVQPALSAICCYACAYVHSKLGISWANCICCFYIGGCNYTCPLPVALSPLETL